MGKVTNALIFICLFTLLSNEGISAVNKKNRQKKRISITKVKRELNKQVSTMNKLKLQVDRLEAGLGKSNKKYVEIIKTKKEIENSIYDVRDYIEANESKLKTSYQNANDALTGVVVNSLDDSEDPSVLLSNKLLAKILKKRLFTLKSQMKKNGELKLRLTKLENQYLSYADTERELADVVSKLEARKNKVAAVYSVTSEKRDKLQASYDKLKTRRYLKKNKKLVEKALKLDISFDAPIGSFTGMAHKKKKGISFYFKEMQAVTAPAPGKVVFQGKVGSFGKIVFIDHGNDLRSVILGNYFPKVSKGMSVSKGDVIGYTERLGNKTGEIYYELRKKNKALNTIIYVDKASLSMKRL